MSPELITNVIFGVVMVVLGLIAIWIVKWSTNKMIRAAAQASPSRVVIDPESLLPLYRSLSSTTVETDESTASTTPRGHVNRTDHVTDHSAESVTKGHIVVHVEPIGKGNAPST